MKPILILFAAVLALWGGPAAAELKVVATLADLGDIARIVGGDDVKVDVLCPGPTDPHYLPAKPSLARKLGKADLLVYNGLDLEVGWLPTLLGKARNPRVRPGAPGELDCSTALDHILDVPEHEVSRAEGDIHPQGNPHYYLDPHSMVLVARLMAERMGEIDPENALAFANRAEEFVRELDARIAQWEIAAASVREHHILLYHQTWAYLVHWLDLDVYGEIEHRPGISPSPKHVQSVIKQGLELGDVIVVAATWSHLDVAVGVADRIGAPLAILPAATGAEDGIDGYIALMDEIIKRLAAAAQEEQRS